MQDLSLHILDIAENSTRAHATEIEIEVIEDEINDVVYLKIKDNGDGIEESKLKSVENPFYTTRTTRRVGLGISLLKQNCERTGGSLVIQSQLGEGTEVIACMQYSHIDRLPLGDMASTWFTLIEAHPYIDWNYHHKKKEKEFKLDLKAIKIMLEEVPIYEPQVMTWIKKYILMQYEGF